MFDFLQPTTLCAWLDSTGPWAAGVFLALQIGQVLLFFVPGDLVQWAGGVVLGTWQSSWLGLLGTLAGGLMAFGLARGAGRKRAEGWMAEHERGFLAHLLNHPRLGVALVILFLLPGIPKDFLCYAAGLSALNWRRFALISLARFPGLVLTSWIGSASTHLNAWFFWGLLGLILAVGAALATLAPRWIRWFLARG